MKFKIIYKEIEIQIEYERFDTFTYQLSAIKEVIQTTIKEYNNNEK
jgi:hypothetical protein